MLNQYDRVTQEVLGDLEQKKKDRKILAFLDVETTGLDPHTHEVIQLAIILDDFQSGQTIFRYQEKFYPQRLDLAHPKALEVNGFTPEKWAGSPLLTEKKFRQIASILQDTIIAGQNTKFDYGFLRKYISLFQLEDFRVRHTLDNVTLAYDRLYRRGLRDLSQRHLAEFLGVVNRNPHDAFSDALTTREIFYKLWKASWLDLWEWSLKIKIEAFRDKSK